MRFGYFDTICNHLSKKLANHEKTKKGGLILHRFIFTTNVIPYNKTSRTMIVSTSFLLLIALKATSSFVSAESNQRHLQDVFSDLLDCSTDPAVIFEDDPDGLELYGDETYKPTCTCEESPIPAQEYFDNNPLPEDFTNITAIFEWLTPFLEILNQDFSFSRSQGCSNACSTCFDGYCGLFDTSSSISFVAMPVKNVTTADLLPLASSNDTINDAAQFVVDSFRIYSGDSKDTICYQYTSGEMGTVCSTLKTTFSSDEGIGVDEFQNAFFESVGEVSCEITLDGTACSSCEFLEDGFCLEADCTNIAGAGAMITCPPSKEQFVGPLGALYSIDFANETDYTFGTCDVEGPNDGDSGTTALSWAAVVAMLSAAWIFF